MCCTWILDYRVYGLGLENVLYLDFGFGARVACAVYGNAACGQDNCETHAQAAYGF